MIDFFINVMLHNVIMVREGDGRLLVVVSNWIEFHFLHGLLFDFVALSIFSKSGLVVREKVSRALLSFFGRICDFLIARVSFP